jgi:hypothetical protein
MADRAVRARVKIMERVQQKLAFWQIEYGTGIREQATVEFSD